ncbi:hypothetical protein LINGRAHAP2_LOCUS14991 [Linum grandiflorum]
MMGFDHQVRHIAQVHVNNFEPWELPGQKNGLILLFSVFFTYIYPTSLYFLSLDVLFEWQIWTSF